MLKLRDNGQIHMSEINLEGLDDSELAQVAEHPAVHLLVRRMAGVLIDARKNRIAGHIQTALGLERKFDYLYEQLPKQLRW